MTIDAYWKPDRSKACYKKEKARTNDLKSGQLEYVVSNTRNKRIHLTIASKLRNIFFNFKNYMKFNNIF